MPTQTTNPIALYHSTGEARAASRLVRKILAKGFAIQVEDEIETLLEGSRDHGTIMRELGASGENTLILIAPDGKRTGWFWLIYGNDPSELVNDYSDNETCNAIWQAWDGTVSP